MPSENPMVERNRSKFRTHTSYFTEPRLIRPSPTLGKSEVLLRFFQAGELTVVERLINITPEVR